MNPFDAAWALLKQWEDTDWQGEQQPPADDWADVQWGAPPDEHGLITPTMPEGHSSQFVNPPPMSAMQLARVRQRAMQAYNQRGRQVAGQIPFPESAPLPHFQEAQGLWQHRPTDATSNGHGRFLNNTWEDIHLQRQMPPIPGLGGIDPSKFRF